MALSMSDVTGVQVMSRRPAQLWPRWLFRAAATVEAASAFGQAVFAGGFLAGHYDLLALHHLNGQLSGYAAIAQFLAAILLWRPGRGPGWAALACLALLAAVMAQIALGFARVLVIHVPLGVAVIGSAMVLLVWAWKPTRGRDGGW